MHVPLLLHSLILPVTNAWALPFQTASARSAIGEQPVVGISPLLISSLGYRIADLLSTLLASRQAVAAQYAF